MLLIYCKDAVRQADVSPMLWLPGYALKHWFQRLCAPTGQPRELGDLDSGKVDWAAMEERQSRILIMPAKPVIFLTVETG